MYFLRNIIFHFPSRKNITFSRKRNAIFPDDTRKIPVFQCYFLERISFQNIWRKYHISIIYLVIFWGTSSFIFRQKNKIIFSRKGNIIFPDDTRNVPKHDFFGLKKIKNLNCIKRCSLHKPLIRIWLICQKIAFYMCDTDCWWHILKGAKIFWSYAKTLLNFSAGKKL